MPNEDFIEKLASQLKQSASVRNVYGEPVIAGEKTIIPVAIIAYGFGGGYGQGKKNKPKNGEDNNKNAASGEGAGGGGGMYARPKGVFEITPKSTRFIPASNTRTLLLGIGLGFLIKSIFFGKKNYKK